MADLPRATTKRSSFKRVVEEDPDPDPSYLDQPEWADRKKAYERDEFHFMHVYALCEVLVPAYCQASHFTTFPLGTPGLYGIESDSDQSYFDEVYAEECRSLEHMLKVLNVEIIEDAPTTAGDQERTAEPPSRVGDSPEG